MLIDSHCHLDFPDFAEELPEIIARAREAGVGQIITISTLVHRLPRLIEICERFDTVRCTVGTHPNHANEEPEITAADLIAASQHPLVVGIGEAGLDYFYDTQTPADQRRGLLEHIAASRQTGLPLVIHSRSADDDMAEILVDETAKGAFPFVLHCFSSGPALAATGIALGGYVSFSGILTFPKSQDLRDIAATIPLDRLLVETDAPYLAPKRWRGKRNEPSYVVNTAEVLAEVKGVPLSEMAEILTENTYRLFGKLPRI